MKTLNEMLSEEMSNIGIALQSSSKAKPLRNIDQLLEKIYNDFFNLRNSKLNPDTLGDFMTLRLILNRIT